MYCEVTKKNLVNKENWEMKHCARDVETIEGAWNEFKLQKQEGDQLNHPHQLL